MKVKGMSEDRLKEALKWCKENEVKRYKEVIALLNEIIKELRGGK